MVTRLLSLLSLALLLFAASSGASTAAETFRVEPLTIETREGAKYPFQVEIAESPAQMAQGLMFREAMAPDAGMLFVFPQDRVATMWMKNTLIPLDMLFIDSGGRIAGIHERAQPHSLATIASSQPVRAVLELNGGLAARLGIRPGDRVLHPAFE